MAPYGHCEWRFVFTFVACALARDRGPPNSFAFSPALTFGMTDPLQLDMSDEEEEDPKAESEAPTQGSKRKLEEASASGSAAAKRGKINRAKAGEQFCPPCNRVHPLSDFPSGKGMCGPAFNAVRNIKAAAHTQGEQEWFEQAALVSSCRVGCIHP